MTKMLWLAFLLPMLMLTGCDETLEDENPIVTVDETGSTTVNLRRLQETLDTIAQTDLSQEEIDGLMYMREEEKLAHDVYTLLHERWGYAVFVNIANSEQTHTDAIYELINRYGLTDPVGGNTIGQFTDPSLKELNDALVESGSTSLIDALMVGAAIEEIDMIDINHYIDQIDGNDDIVLVYEKLIQGSRNHLRAFVSSLQQQGVTYVPQYMDPLDYQEIIDSSNGNGNGRNGNGGNGRG